MTHTLTYAMVDKHAHIDTYKYTIVLTQNDPHRHTIKHMLIDEQFLMQTEY